MTYDVVISPRESEIKLTIDAASPQLAARKAQGRCLGLHCDVVSVNGTPCIGVCERCGRHIFENQSGGHSLDGEILCGLCVRELVPTR